MPTRWLSFWNQETQRRNRSQDQKAAGPDDGDIYIPFGQGKVASGDTVYCVAVVGGELRLFGRVIVERIKSDDDHTDSIDAWAKPGTQTPFDFQGQPVNNAEADRLVYLHADGSAHSLARRSGRLVGHAFQGRSSIRELASGHQSLDRLITAS